MNCSWITRKIPEGKNAFWKLHMTGKAPAWKGEGKYAPIIFIQDSPGVLEWGIWVSLSAQKSG